MNLDTLIPVWCEQTKTEYKEEEWQPTGYDSHRAKNIISKPPHRQESALDVLFGLFEDKEDFINRCVRFIRAIEKEAKTPGNFKAKAIGEKLAKNFNEAAAEIIFKDIDPVLIVKLKKEGKL